MNKMKHYWAALVAVFVGGIGTASAAFDTSAIDDMASDVGTLATVGYGILAAVLVAMIGMKLVKKVAGKAT